MPAASAAGSRGGTTRPVGAPSPEPVAAIPQAPSRGLTDRICSGIPPVAVATTGVPQAKASNTEFGNVSARAA